MDENSPINIDSEQSPTHHGTSRTYLANMNKKRIIKNFLVLAVAHCLVFTAFDSLSNLQSTMNLEQGIGVVSQAVIYAFFTVSSLFLPSLIIKKLGCKNTLVLSVLGMCPYIVSNVYPKWETHLLTGALCGTSLGPLWAARSLYVNELSSNYAVHIRGSFDVTNAWFFGMYSFFHENAEIWGNAVSYLVLKPENASQYISNSTINLKCGSEFCDFQSYDMNPNLEPPSSEKRLRLILIFLALVVLAAATMKIMMDPLPEDDCTDESESENEVCNLLMTAMRHLRNRDQLLLLPLSFYCGLADGFYNTDFTKSYIACSLGIWYVGLVTITYGIVCAVIDCSSGLLVKWLTRKPVFLFAAASHLVAWISCLCWTPSPDAPAAFFVLAGVYGLGASVWWAQIAALYGVHFKENEGAAFSNFFFWSSLGLLIAYSYSDYVCTYVKIYILVALLIVSLIGYLIVDSKSMSKVN